MKQFVIVIFNTFILFLIVCSAIYLYGRSSRGRLLPIVGEWGYPKRNPHTLKWKVNSARNKIDADIFKVNPYANTKGTKHILYMGGSNTVGEDVLDKDALEAWVSKMEEFKDFNPYILAYIGWGPHNVLGYLRTNNIQKKIKEEKGVAIYRLMEDHHARVCGVDHYFDWNSGSAPIYSFKNGKVTFEGMYADSFKYHLYLFKSGLRNIIVQKANMSEFVYSQDCRLKVVNHLKEIKRLYLEAFPKGNFFVQTLPVYLTDDDNYKRHQKTLDLLKDNGISIIDPTNFFLREMQKMGKNDFYYTTETGHLNSKYYQLMMKYYETYLSDTFNQIIDQDKELHHTNTK